MFLVSCIHSKGSVICKLTLNFAADPLDTSDELMTDLQAEVFTGKLGLFTVDKSHVLNTEPKVGKMILILHAYR